MFPLLVDNLKSEDYFYAQKKEHEKENSIKIAFYCKLFGGCVQPVFTIMKQAHWTVWHFRMLKHWPKAKMMMMPIAMVMVQSIAEATK